MPHYCEEKQRRIGQFAQYLRLMGLRRNKFAKGDCFIIFDEAAPEGVDAPQIKESAAVRVDCLANDGSASEGESPPPDWSLGESFRYIQFAFMRDCFYLELPNNTVFSSEAETIFQQRPGFYYARNRPDLCWVRANWKDIVTWNPLQKIYLYRDEESAAEDMAFILFQVWKFPVDWPWYFKAATFKTGHRFEDGKRID